MIRVLFVWMLKLSDISTQDLLAYSMPDTQNFEVQLYLVIKVSQPSLLYLTLYGGFKNSPRFCYSVNNGGGLIKLPQKYSLVLTGILVELNKFIRRENV